MTHYWVESPAWEEIVFALDDGTGATEPVCAVVQVEAATKREAKIKALRTEKFRKWAEDARGDNRNPFTGLKVEVDEACICPCEELVWDDLLHDYITKECVSCQEGKHQMSQNYEEVFAERKATP